MVSITWHTRNTWDPACAQWCLFSIVRAKFQKYDLYSAPIARALPRYIVPFFKFFKTGKCFKTMPFPVSCVSQKPLAFQKHSLLLIQPKTHAKTLSERSEKCATVQVLTGALQGIAARWLSAHYKTIARVIARAIDGGPPRLGFVTPCPNKQGKNAYFSKVLDASGTASDAVNVRKDCKHFGPPLWVVLVEERGPFGGPS